MWRDKDMKGRGAGKGHMYDDDDEDWCEDSNYREDSAMYAEPSQDYAEVISTKNPAPAPTVSLAAVTTKAAKPRGREALPEEPPEGTPKEPSAAASSAQPPKKSKAERVEDARVLLKSVGVLSGGMADDGVLALAASVEANHEERMRCLSAVWALRMGGRVTPDDAQLMSSRGIHVRVSSTHEALIVLPPSFPEECPQIDCTHNLIKCYLEHVMENSAIEDPALLLTAMVRFLCAIPADFFYATGATTGVSSAEWAVLNGVWRGVAAETFEDTSVPLKVLALQKDGSTVSKALDKDFIDSLCATMQERMNRRRAATGSQQQQQAARPPREPRAPRAVAAANIPRGAVNVPTSVLRASMDSDAALKDLLAEVRELSLAGISFAYRPLLQPLPPAIGSLSHVTRLDLSGAQINHLPPMRQKLTHVYMRRNQFTEFPETLLAMASSLAVVDFSFNQISVIPRGFGGLQNLRGANFEYNQLTDIDAEFGGLTKLETLELTDNELRAVPPEIGSIAPLWRLKLGANPILQIPPEVYHRGTAVVKRFLVELSPHNLPVPPSTMLEEIGSLAAQETGDRLDCTLHCVSDRSMVLCHAFVVQARAPRLLSLAAKSPRLPDGSQTVEIYIDGADLTRDDIDCFVQLLYTGRYTTASTNVDSERIGMLVARFGTASLTKDLAAFHAGSQTKIRAGDSISADVGALMNVLSDDLVGDVVTFIVGEKRREFWIPKALASARCLFMRSMFQSGLAESSRQQIDLPDQDPGVFAAFVTYLFTDSHGKKMTPENVVALLFLAAEYQVARLRAMAECMVGFNVDVDNVAQVIQIAYFIDSERLKNACFYYAAANYSAVKATPAYAELQEEVRADLESRARKIKAEAAASGGAAAASA